MKTIRIISFTKEGVELSFTIKQALEHYTVELFAKESFKSNGLKTANSAKEWAQRYFDNSDALIFIGASGIAVRSIAQLLQSKTSDPAVLVIDEKGQFVIPLVSGHLGGAVDLADEISQVLGACAVQTTASDVRNMTAVDVWARKKDFYIENPKQIVDITSAQLRQNDIGVVVSEREIETPFTKTLYIRPKNLVLGIGCKKGVSFEALKDFVVASLKEHGLSPHSVSLIASIDLKAEEDALKKLQAYFNCPFKCFTAEKLSKEHRHISKSDFVKSYIGLDCVCEQAALYAAGPSSELIVSKQASPALATLAVAKIPAQNLRSEYAQALSEQGAWLALVGIGPGSKLDMTMRAIQSLEQADVIIGYKRYIDLIRGDFSYKELIASNMKSEIDRCKNALELAQHKRVALISSGDAGIYGMSSLVYELKDKYPEYKEVSILSVSGVTAGIAAANLLGSPLSNDFACVSLSDLLTPWQIIAERLTSLAKADIPIVLYNPRSKGRPDLLEKALKIINDNRENKAMYIGHVKNASRDNEEIRITSYKDFDCSQVDMFSTVIVSASHTLLIENKLVSARGYSQKKEF